MVIQCTILIVITNQVLYPGLCLMAAKQTENSFAILFKCKEAQLHFGVTNFGFCLEALKTSWTGLCVPTMQVSIKTDNLWSC